MGRLLVLVVFLVSAGCASAPPRPVSPLDFSWLEGCWRSADPAGAWRWSQAGGGAWVGVWSLDDERPQVWLLEPRPEGLTLVRPITAPGGPVETFGLVGGGPQEAVFAGAAGLELRLEGGEGRLRVDLAGPHGGAVLFDGRRDGCDGRRPAA